MKRMILAAVAAVAVAGSAVAQSGVKYPYITTASDGGVVVVLRDDKGGVGEAALFPERLAESKTGNEQSTDNRMSRKFRVQKAEPNSRYNWFDAIVYCDNLTEEGYSDWRLPSQRELMMIWILGGGSNGLNGNKNDTGVGSATYPISTTSLYQQSGFTPFNGSFYWSTTPSSDADAWNLYTGNGTMASYSKYNTYNIRCVRDEW